MKLNITKTIVLLVIITLSLYFISEYHQTSTFPDKKRVTFSDKVDVKHFTKDPPIEELKLLALTEEPAAYNEDDNDGDNWEDAFKTSLLDEASKKLQKKILNSSARYANYATDHQLVVSHDAKIAEPYMRPVKKTKEESIGRSIKDIYDSQTANVKPTPKKLKSKTDNTWEYEDECVMNGGLMTGKGLTGHDPDGSLYGAVTYKDDFTL